jgi:hypothetical protein
METIPWSNILVGLLIRFAGVFLVLGLLQAGIRLSGAITSKLLSARGHNPSDH